VQGNGCKADFKPGEAALVAMNKQLKAMKQQEDEKRLYKADGIVKLYGTEKTEILLL
jgi:predicted DNA-binding helix-hairpin-helix protein